MLNIFKPKSLQFYLPILIELLSSILQYPSILTYLIIYVCVIFLMKSFLSKVKYLVFNSKPPFFILNFGQTHENSQCVYSRQCTKQVVIVFVSLRNCPASSGVEALVFRRLWMSVTRVTGVTPHSHSLSGADNSVTFSVQQLSDCQHKYLLRLSPDINTC